MKKEIRIKKNEEINDIVKLKHNYNSFYFFAYWRLNQTGTRVAITASKKHFKKAYQRNYAKRILREALRPTLINNIPVDIVIIAKAKILDVDFEKIKKDMQEMICFFDKKLKKEAIIDRKEVKWKTED